MNNKFESFKLLQKLSSKYKISINILENRFFIYHDFLKNSKEFNNQFYIFLKKYIYLIYLFYLISPLHQLFINILYLFINKFKDKKVILNINKPLIDRWKKFINYESVHTIILDNFLGKIIYKRLTFENSLFIILKYIKLLFLFSFDHKRRPVYFYDIELYQKFLNDYMVGSFLGGFSVKTSLDAAAYTLSLLKYLGLKEINKKIKICALQVHSASKEPMMIFFQADKVLSINKDTSIYYSQFTGERDEVVVGSRLLEKNNESLIYNPKIKSLLLLFGNTHHPKGIYYGKKHNSIYKEFLKDFINLSEEFPSWDFKYLHHRNFKSNYEIDFLSPSSFVQLDKTENVYSTSMKYAFVVSFGSTVVSELYEYHPNIFLYSPNKESPYRVKDNQFRYLSGYNQLRKCLLKYEEDTTNKAYKATKNKIYSITDFDQKVLSACL